jgi:membrane protease YdiL (CAAX protease family)
VLHALAAWAATGVWILLLGRVAPGADRWIPSEAVRRAALLLLFVVLETLTIVLLARALRGERRRGLLPDARGLRRWLLRGLGIGIIAGGFGPAVLTFLGKGRLHPAPPMPIEAALAIVLGLPLAVLWEEVVYRGVILRWLQPIGAFAAVLLSALMFASLHFLAEPFVPGRFVLLTALGGLFGIAYLASGDLAFPIGVHLGLNLMGFLLASDPLAGGVWRFLIDAEPGPVLALSLGGIAVSSFLSAALPRALRRR